MDVQKKLDEIVAAVEGARAMPMSASCVINRSDLLALLTDLRSALPESLSEAQALLGDREQMVAEAHQEAERIIAAAHEERGLLISHTELARHSQEEADRILADARRESEEIRAEADEYVDSKLANFEVVLTKTLGAVDRGRDKLLGRAPDGGPDGEYGEDADVPERTSDPAELRRRADTYVDAKLGAFETVLAKTLEAVGRGRQKLAGHRPIDELAEHLAAQDAQDARDGLAGVRSDAEYLAGLADPQPVQSVQAVPDQQPPATGEYGYAAAAEGQAEYGYPQDGYGYADYAGYPAPAEHPGQAGHAAQAGYEQQSYDAYGQIPQQGGYDAWQQQPQQQAYGYEQAQIPQQQPYGSLDETSFFDTSLINVEHLRELDQGR